MKHFKILILFLILAWTPPVSAGLKDCLKAARFLFKRPHLTLLKETDFKIVREKEDTFAFFYNAVPPPRPEEKNFSQWKDQALPTIPSDTLLTEEQRQLFIPNYAKYLASQGFSFSPEKQLPLIQVNQYKVISSHDSTRFELPLLIPVNPQGLPVPKRLNKIKRALRELPISALQKTQYIALSPYPHNRANEFFVTDAETESLTRPNFKRANINLFPLSLYKTDSELISTLQHELGHVMALHFYQKGPDSRWLEAIKNDAKRVSDYHDTSPSEDFAETFAFYLNKRGSFIKRLQFFHRFQILDEIFETL